MKKYIMFLLIFSFAFSLQVLALSDSEAKSMASNYKDCNEISKASFSSDEDKEKVCSAKDCRYVNSKCVETGTISNYVYSPGYEGTPDELVEKYSSCDEIDKDGSNLKGKFANVCNKKANCIFIRINGDNDGGTCSLKDEFAKKYSSCKSIIDDTTIDDKTKESVCNSKSDCTWNNNTCIDKELDTTVNCETLDKETCNTYKICTWNKENNKCYGEVDCTKLNTKDECKAFRKCSWNNNSCSENYVASNACEENNVKKVLRLFGYLILLLRLAVPLIIIILGTFDVYEAVIDKDEKLLSKKIKQLGIRIIGGMFIFFIPTILNAIFMLSDTLNIVSTSEYQSCATCLLKPSNCVISENKEENDNTITTTSTTKTTTITTTNYYHNN